MFVLKVIVIITLLFQNFALKFDGPCLPHWNFIPLWNAPTSECKSKWDIDLRLGDYNIVDNVEQQFHGEYINIFNKKLGLWPYYDDDGAPVNGGLPQVSV
jgi:hypothetical protein